MAISKVCEYCNEPYIAERKTSKFCSTACRVANHRAEKKFKAKHEGVADIIRSIADGLQHKSTSYESAIELSTIRRLVDMYFPPNTRWWRCDTCQTSVMKFLPTEDSCQCGKDAKWYIQRT